MLLICLGNQLKKSLLFIKGRLLLPQSGKYSQAPGLTHTESETKDAFWEYANEHGHHFNVAACPGGAVISREWQGHFPFKLPPSCCTIAAVHSAEQDKLFQLACEVKRWMVTKTGMTFPTLPSSNNKDFDSLLHLVTTLLYPQWQKGISEQASCEKGVRGLLQLRVSVLNCSWPCFKLRKQEKLKKLLRRWRNVVQKGWRHIKAYETLSNVSFF